MRHLDELRDRLPADLEELARKHGVPGASVAILVGDRVLEATAGVVSSRSRIAVTPDSLFMIQSITKVATATLVMQLVDDGLLGLDDPVRLHLPAFRTQDAMASGLITVRHMLTHTGGFEGDLWSATTCGPDALERFVEDLVAGARQVSPPGERFSYCNAGFGTLGRVVEVLRGMTYEQAFRRFVAEPLGIDELAFSADQALAFRTAIGHVGGQDGTPIRPLRNWAVMPPSNPAAGNQLAMSARGLLAVVRMHLRDGRAPDGTAVLSEESARLMRQRQVRHPESLGRNSGHGLGWWLRRGGLVEHGGGSTGVASMARVAPAHDVAAVVLANGDSGGAMIEELLEPWFAGLPGIDPRPESGTPTAESVVSDAWRYVGQYEQRQATVEVGHTAAGLLRYVRTPRRDAIDMAERAGMVEHVQRGDLRPLGGDLFMAIADHDGSSHPVEFLDRTADGRARTLFNLDGGRALVRADGATTTP